ncbi:MAG: formimidoylglutamase [bacterium]
MSLEFLSPVADKVVAHTQLLPQQALGKRIAIHSKQQGLPELENIKLAIVGVSENRNHYNYIGEQISFDEIRTTLYQLFPGNWAYNMADLGDLNPGETVEDTYHALQAVVAELLKENIIPIILGGSQDLTYAIYRAYDGIHSMVNIANVDSNFDLGDSSKPIKNNSFVGKIIMEKPYNLFNYSTVGYQTYFNSQEEINLMESLYFEAYRLGEVSADIRSVEPIMRDAHIVSVDMKAIRSSELSDKQRNSPNGLDGKEICAIARYAGISNKVSSFGVFEYMPSLDDSATSMLIAQSIWYFIEGVNYRVLDDDFNQQNNFQRFTVLVEEDELFFVKSKKSGRWWIEIPFLQNVNNKLKRHTLLPCMHEDYVAATSGKIPERWYKACRKNSI